MRYQMILAGLMGFGILSGCGGEQQPPRIPPMPVQAPHPKPGAAVANAKLLPQQPALAVAADIQARLAKFAPFVMDVDDKSVSAEDKAVLKKLIEANQLIQEIFVRQLNPANPELRARLAANVDQADALRYFDIMSGPWDGLAHDEPFVGTDNRAPGAGFYPADMTKAEFETYVAKNPAQKDAFQGYFTVIDRHDGQLRAVPYSDAYKKWLAPAAQALRDAAALAKEPTLKKFLELRAKAFETNDYMDSDKAWMDVTGNIEATIGPYETYADQMFQYKASFEAFIALRDIAESKKLEVIGKQLTALEKNLPLAGKYKKDASSRKKESPIDVVQLLANAGQDGVQAVAYNLPNDEHVRAEKGSKKVLLKNLMQGKFEKMVKPIAARVLDEKQLAMLSFDAMFTYVLMHEVAHGIGPGFIKMHDGSTGEVSKALKELYGGVEEAKADITGLVDAQYLIDHKIYPKDLEKQLYVAYLATAFRQMRFGLKEAHGRGVVASVNYLIKKGGIVLDPKTNRFRVDFTKIKGAVRDLAHEYLTIEAEGDYDGAKKFFEKYAVVSPELEKAVASIGTDIPVDIAPIFPAIERSKSW